MANKRLITSDIWADDFFGTLPMMQRLLWIGLFSRCADDQGRMVDNPIVIRSMIFPYDDIPASDIDDGLSRFASDGKIQRYCHEGKKYIQLLRWWEHQTMQWAMPSKYPAPPAWDDRIRTTYKGKYIAINWATSKITLPDHLDSPPGQPTLPSDVAGQNLNPVLVINPVKELEVVDKPPQFQEPEAWKDDPTIDPPAATPAPYIHPSRKAQSLLLKCGRMAAIPAKDIPRVEQVLSMIDTYGETRVGDALTEAFRKWISTPRKNGGGNYSPLNFGWVDWAQEALMDVGADVKPAYRPNMSKEELMRYLGVKPE